MIPDLAVGSLPLVGLALWASHALALPSGHAWAAGIAYLILCGILLVTAPAHLPGPGAGWANRVTLFRATLVLPVAALLVTPGRVAGSTAWAVVTAASLALALDGIDGALARRTGTATRFGARFDMELDAFLILVLSALVWTSTPLGFWVVWIGLLRYAFVLGGWIWAPLRADLPESFRRKAVCVVQVTALLVALAPVTPPTAIPSVAATALVLLVYSFGVDVLWLVRQASGPGRVA